MDASDSFTGKAMARDVGKHQSIALFQARPLRHNGRLYCFLFRMHTTFLGSGTGLDSESLIIRPDLVFGNQFLCF